HVAELLVEDQLRRHPRIRAGKDDSERLLTGGECLALFREGRVRRGLVGHEAFVAVPEPFEGFGRGDLFAGFFIPAQWRGRVQTEEGRGEQEKDGRVANGATSLGVRKGWRSESATAGIGRGDPVVLHGSARMTLWERPHKTSSERDMTILEVRDLDEARTLL